MSLNGTPALNDARTSRRGLLAREGLRGRAAGPELGHDRSPRIALADLASRSLDQDRAWPVDRESGRSSGRKRRDGQLEARRRGPGSIGVVRSPRSRPRRRSGDPDPLRGRELVPAVDGHQERSDEPVHPGRPATGGARTRAGSALPGGNMAASSRGRRTRSTEGRGRRLTPQHRTATLEEIDTGASVNGRRQEARWPTTDRWARSRPSGTPSTASRRPAGVRGADGRGGLLVGLVVALPPQPAVADRRRGRLAGRLTFAPRRTIRSSRST